MKSLSAVLIIGIFFPVLCFGQIQTGNASYNSEKSGYHISHSSLSFGVRVKVTNLKNNQQVIATVNGRIPASDPRIADVYKDAGDAIGMAASGYTEVRLEQLLPEQPTDSATVPEQPTDSAQSQTAVQQSSTRSPSPVQQSSAPLVMNVPPVENSQTVSPPPVQYVLAEIPAPTVQSCAVSPICVAILVLAIVAVLLLVVILVLILCQSCLPRWAWFHPLWIRRHIRYRKNHRR
ncbi:MAG: hypothetical protein LBG05_06810 [Treponema sp.]|jgi:hypothetical protein|nr:hypothetical protein [Treponema sp.]